MDRLLIFGRHRAVHILNRSRIWDRDETFDITPPLFYQVFMIFGEKFGRVHPFILRTTPEKGQRYIQIPLMSLSGYSPSLFPFVANFICSGELVQRRVSGL